MDETCYMSFEKSRVDIVRVGQFCTVIASSAAVPTTGGGATQRPQQNQSLVSQHHNQQVISYPLTKEIIKAMILSDSILSHHQGCHYPEVASRLPWALVTLHHESSNMQECLQSRITQVMDETCYMSFEKSRVDVVRVGQFCTVIASSADLCSLVI